MFGRTEDAPLTKARPDPTVAGHWHYELGQYSVMPGVTLWVRISPYGDDDLLGWGAKIEVP